MYYNKNIRTINTALSLVKKKYFIEYKSDKIIAISKCVESQLTDEFKVPPGQISLIYNYAEPYKLSNLRQAIKKKPFTILSVGRFHYEKNFETLLKSMKYLNNPDIILNLIGSGDLKKEYHKYIQMNNLNVVLTNPENDLESYFLDCDICVLTSLVDPLPTFMIQAGFFKKPFIGSNVDGISETIIDGYNGLLFAKEDFVELGEKIMNYYGDISLMLRCSNNLYDLVNKKHIPEVNVKKIVDLYNSLLLN